MRKWLQSNPELDAAARKVYRRVYEGGKVVVIPDVVIHERATNVNSQVVIEAKFGNASTREIDYAKMKLKAFLKDHYRYCHAILLTFPSSWDKFDCSKSFEFINGA